MKTVIIIHQYFMKPDQAGAHRIYSHALNLSKKGLNVVVISTDSYGNQKEFWAKEVIRENLVVHRLKNSGYFHGKKASNNQRFSSFLRFAFFSFLKVFFMKKDLIYATSTPLTVAIPALLLKLFLGKKYLFEVRDLWPEVPIQLGYLKNRFLIFLSYSLEYLAYYFSSAVIVVSPGMETDIRLKGFKNKKIFTVENGCDDFFNSNQTKNQNHFGIKNINNKKVILYAGSLTAAYGINYLIDLAKNMNEISNDVIFLIAGRGDMEEEMIEQAKSLNILDVNFFYLGAVPKKDIPKLYGLAKLSMCIIRNDKPEIMKHAVNNKFFDSIASGTPICTNFDSFQTSISIDNNFCIYVKDLNIRDAALKVLEYLNNEDWYNKASNNALLIAAEKFNRKKQSEKIYEIINGT